MKRRIFDGIDINDMPLYGVWCVMKQRCHNLKDHRYNYYGERGIKVCPSWRNSFIKFYKWAMKNGYKQGLTIERNNNDGNYSPKNCSIATKKQQGRNRRNNVMVMYNNVLTPITEVCEILNISRYEAKKRYLNTGNRESRKGS